GFVGPIASAMEGRSNEDAKPFELVKIALLASVRGYPPPVAIEFARKQLFSDLRPSFADLEGELKGAK
ncbi:MAG: flagellar motor stator protein MotA, partial [Lysobacteraceae bacterium]